MTIHEKLVDVLKNMDDEDILSVCRDCAGWNGELDDLCWEDFDEDFFSTFFSDPMEAARATFFGSIQSWADSYIRFNAYGNLESTAYLDYSDDYDEIADAVESNHDNLSLPDELEECFEEDEDSED